MFFATALKFLLNSFLCLQINYRNESTNTLHSFLSQRHGRRKSKPLKLLASAFKLIFPNNHTWNLLLRRFSFEASSINTPPPPLCSHLSSRIRCSAFCKYSKFRKENFLIPRFPKLFPYIFLYKFNLQLKLRSNA